MLRITRVSDGRDEVLKLEGSLSGPWVQALADVAALEGEPERALVLDLASVRFVDAQGARLLRRLIERGAEVRDGSRYVAALLGRVGS